jgi:sortase (surface protein transpeptidase)
VFYRLKDLVPGDLVDVGRSDGKTARYRVTQVTTVEKDQFPTQQVYGPTPGAELRLITCGGSFDRAARHYLRNVVVSGVLVGPS